jgi:hypothetical protein
MHITNDFIVIRSKSAGEHTVVLGRNHYFDFATKWRFENTGPGRDSVTFFHPTEPLMITRDFDSAFAIYLLQTATSEERVRYPKLESTAIYKEGVDWKQV